jgi:formyl-CoA transferase
MEDGSRLAVPGVVPKLSETPGEHRRNAPRLGQDTDDVLRELGISPAQVSELKRRGIIAASD